MYLRTELGVYEKLEERKDDYVVVGSVFPVEKERVIFQANTIKECLDLIITETSSGYFAFYNAKSHLTKEFYGLLGKCKIWGAITYRESNDTPAINTVAQLNEESEEWELL